MLLYGAEYSCVRECRQCTVAYELPEKAGHYMLRVLSEDERTFFRDQFREARAEALRNAEDFDGLLFAVERLGSLLTKGNGHGLGDYKKSIVALASKSPLGSNEVAINSFSIPFETLYVLVSRARNDALHQGAFARHLTVHATELAIILEDALMADARYVREFMVRSPVCASIWQPLSLVRQTMLSNSFSYLPVLDDRKGVKKRWLLVSDRALARYLRTGQKERARRMAQTLRDAVEQEHIVLDRPHVVCPDDSVEKVFAAEDHGRPALVFKDGENDGNRPLLGIMMPFDVL